MRMLTWTMLAAFVAVLPAIGAKADMEAKAGGPQAGDWAKRTPVTPDPDKVVVPPGYKVGVFKAGLDTPSSATVDKDGNLWVTISGVLLGSPEAISSIRRTSRFSTRTESCCRRSARASSRR